MHMQIQQATPQFATAIADVKQVVWNGDSSSADHIARVIAEPDHASHVALDVDQVIGFVDGFLTLASDGTRRWEVDLLAVLPDYRGHGTAKQLVTASVGAGQEMGTDMARGLIAVDNIASEKAFAHAGFVVDEKAVYTLYVSSAAYDTQIKHPAGLYLLPVNTFGYRGVWLEGELSADAFRAAQHIRTHYRWDVAGAVIPLDNTRGIEEAESCGYALVGHYRWWMKWF